MFDDPSRIIELLVMALFGIGGVKGVELGINRYRNGIQPTTTPGSVNVPVDCVTQGECERAQKTVNDSIHEFRTEVKDDLVKQTQAMTTMSEKLGELRAGLAGGEAVAIKAANHSVREHEQRFSHGRSGQG